MIEAPNGDAIITIYEKREYLALKELYKMALEECAKMDMFDRVQPRSAETFDRIFRDRLKNQTK